MKTKRKKIEGEKSTNTNSDKTPDDKRSKWIEAGAIMIAAIIGAIGGYLAKPAPSEPPIEIVKSVNGWNKGTTLILESWRTFAIEYENYLAKEYKCDPKRVTDSINFSVIDIEEIRKSVADEFEVTIHHLLKAEDADPRDVNLKIREFFGELKVTYNGEAITVDSLTKLGRTLSDKYVYEVHLAYLRNQKPERDSVVRILSQQFLERRQLISEVCTKKLATWYKEPKSGWD